MSSDVLTVNQKTGSNALGTIEGFDQYYDPEYSLVESSIEKSFMGSRSIKITNRGHEIGSYIPQNNLKIGEQYITQLRMWIPKGTTAYAGCVNTIEAVEGNDDWQYVSVLWPEGQGVENTDETFHVLTTVEGSFCYVDCLQTDEGTEAQWWNENTAQRKNKYGFGKEILERMPEHSPIHELDNLGYILVMESIGREFDIMFADAVTNCNAGFSINDTGIYLDMVGNWFGISRGDKTDEEYRTAILGRRSNNLTISGIKRAISLFLNISESEITIINGSEGCCIAGKSIIASKYEGTPQPYAGHWIRESGVLNITLPFGSDLTLIENNIINMVLPGVLSIISNELEA